MVPVTSEYGHLVTSFGLGVLTPVYALLDELIDAGVKSAQPFSVDPRPLQKGVPANPAQKLFFKVMYSKQKEYEERLRKLGIMNPGRVLLYLLHGGNGQRAQERRCFELGGEQRRGIRQQRAGRALQPQLGHHRHLRQHRGMRAGVWPA